MPSLIVNGMPQFPVTSRNETLYIGNFTNFRKNCQQNRPVAPLFLLIRIEWIVRKSDKIMFFAKGGNANEVNDKACRSLQAIYPAVV
jgi:hypothetical protein